MERCANEMNVTQENLENYIRIDDIATIEEMSLNIEDAIENIIEHDPAPEEEEEEDSDLGCDTLGRTSTITTYNEAFKIINDLKTFANDDYIAFQHMKNLEDHFQSNFLQQKILNGAF
ncbi:importin beta [Holotrichia oblita]|uniref:Importin beta n=1 Tax=Holotrichia oblita TaxID=644536 RepID=A0ACB9TRL9_HOLOL|nr:importin beta [Holotrichia oblita]